MFWLFLTLKYVFKIWCAFLVISEVELIAFQRLRQSHVVLVANILDGVVLDSLNTCFLTFCLC